VDKEKEPQLHLNWSVIHKF